MKTNPDAEFQYSSTRPYGVIVCYTSIMLLL